MDVDFSYFFIDTECIITINVTFVSLVFQGSDSFKFHLSLFQ